MDPKLPMTESQVQFHKAQPQHKSDNLGEIRQTHSNNSGENYSEPPNPQSNQKETMKANIFKSMRQRRKRTILISKKIQQIHRPQQEVDPITKSMIVDQVNKSQIKQQLPIQSKIEENIGVGKQCEFCAQHFQNEKLDKAFNCQHIYCLGCLKTYLQTQIKQHKLIKCPQQSCKQPITQQSKSYTSLPTNLLQTYQIIKFRKKIEQNPKQRLCPDEKCKKGYIEIKQGQKSGECKQCKIVYCLTCYTKSHSGKCQTFQQILLKDKFKYRECHTCHRVVERISGCPHMTCKCGSQFCYYCQGNWTVPHRCIRYLAGGDLVTDRLNRAFRCIRVQSYEYQYTFLGFVLKIPYYIVCLIILTLYFCWSLMILAVLIAVGIVCSLLAGYFALQYKMCKEGGCLGYIVFALLLIFLPLGVVIGWIGVFCVCVYNVFPKYLELALSGKLFPFFLLC